MDYVRHSLAALASACLIACGGGDGDADLGLAAPLSTPSTPSTPSTASTATPSAPSDVQVEGCVLDDAGAPAAITVHARGEDGRLLASTTSNERGVYTLRLPARHSVVLSTEPWGHAGLVLLTGRSNFSIAACLRRAMA